MLINLQLGNIFMRKNGGVSVIFKDFFLFWAVQTEIGHVSQKWLAMNQFLWYCCKLLFHWQMNIRGIFSCREDFSPTLHELRGHRNSFVETAILFFETSLKCSWKEITLVKTCLLLATWITFPVLPLATLHVEWWPVEVVCRQLQQSSIFLYVRNLDASQI